jgi:hypothetical protein
MSFWCHLWLMYFATVFGTTWEVSPCTFGIFLQSWAKYSFSSCFFHFIQGGMEVSGPLSFYNRSSIATHSFDFKWLHLWHCLDMHASTMLHGTSELLASCRSHHVWMFFCSWWSWWCTLDTERNGLCNCRYLTNLPARKSRFGMAGTLMINSH